MNEQTTLQDIFRVAYASVRAQRRFSADEAYAASCLMACRTAALGGHSHYCPAGHFEKRSYNSCGHRACPQCAFLRMTDWLERQKARLLACPHTHIIFTIPEELNALWLWNRRLMSDLLFAAVRDTVMQLLSDPEYLGATPGIISALHTWGSSLVLHPHIHCLVTCGGLHEDGLWRSPMKSCLLPAKVVKALFRGKFLAFVRNALKQQRLVIPPGRRVAQVQSLLNKLGRAEWNVRVEPSYDHARGVVTYLARYLRGGPIANRRIVGFDGETVRFRIKDYRHARRRILPLSVGEFVRRVLMHVPVRRMHTVRYYGLYSRNSTDRLNAARERLRQPRCVPIAPLTVADLDAFFGSSDRTHCPFCQRELLVRPIAAVSREPPTSTTITPAA